VLRRIGFVWPHETEANSVSSPQPTDTTSNTSTDSAEEFQDDRPQQDQLVEASPRASATTDSKIDEGGSEEFVDDRTNVSETNEDAGEQSALVSTAIEGQVDLTGNQATEEPEYLDGRTRENALDALAEGSWTPSTISRAFDVTGSVANSIMEMGPDVSHVLKVEDNTDDLTEWPGIGDVSARSIRSTVHELKARGVTRYGLPVDVDDDSGLGRDERDDDDDVDGLDGVESASEQTVKEGIAESLDVPDLWVIVDEHEAAEREPSILVEHPDGYVAEMWLRDEDVPSGACKWDIEYVDPAGTRRDGSGSFHDDAQEALNQLVPHIQEVRAEKRNRAFQQAEQEAVEWPSSIGRYHIDENTESDTHAEYTTRYLRGKTPLGLDYGDDALKIRFFDDTRAYHVGDETFARKKTAIAATQDILNERTRKLNEQESQTVEETDLEPHQIPTSSPLQPDSSRLTADGAEQYTVDIRFATDGISASVYVVSETPGQVDLLEEAWYTWGEVEELTRDSASHITFELAVQHSEIEDEDATV